MNRARISCWWTRATATRGLCRMIHDRTHGEDGIYITYEEDNPIAFNPFYTDSGQFDVEKRESIKTLILTLWKREDEAPKRSEEVAPVGCGECLYPPDYG